jgi:ribosomal protein S18 acetylase RimI-like enzyme
LQYFEQHQTTGIENMITFRQATADDGDPIWDILKGINERGDSFAYYATLPKADMLTYWLDADKHTYVAVENDQILGTFWLRDNQPGRGAHIANAAYAVATTAGGRGLGKKMGLFSLEEARRLGYRAMQFNLVVKTNERAVSLWQSIGFQIIGEIPEAFDHAELGLVNAFIMYQKL